jgi:hypothetical protein
LVSPAGFEPAASWFRTTRAARLRYSEMKNGAGSENRTRNIDGGTVELCQLSYACFARAQARRPAARPQFKLRTMSRGGAYLCHIQVVKEHAPAFSRREKFWYPTRDSNPERRVSETRAYADSASGALQKQKARGPCGAPGLGRLQAMLDR